MAWFLENAWLIPALPLLAYMLITLTPLRRSKPLSAWLATGLMAVAALLALGVGLAVAGGVLVGPNGAVTSRDALSARPSAETFTFPVPNIVRDVRWAPAGGEAEVRLGFLIDPAVAAMLVMVALASSCIHLFSVGYMAHDERQARFFSLISLFTAAMLTMVMASNLLLLFIAWEIMGLCSYLLIAFRYEKSYPDPNQITPRAAARKAFVTTRIGDVLLMVGLAALWTSAGTLELGAGPGQVFNPETLRALNAAEGPFGASMATTIALLIFCGTIGKSAQFPLHVWLPDAMEGPTPVSALIHAATMVAAGVFLVARTYPIFEAGDALPVVAAIGAFTALFAALIAVAQYDIKRILAYSTISQLGFMVAALGIGGWVAAMFHLLTHAFFKALLFLGSGSVIHGMEAAVGPDSNVSQDIRNMGGLKRFMPVTFWTYAAGTLALAGFPGFSGFWSKDEILADAAAHGEWLVLGALMLASFLTAFYMARQVTIVFFGPFRGFQPRGRTKDQEPRTQEPRTQEPGTRNQEPRSDFGPSSAIYGPSSNHEPHESPRTMTVPLVVLALFATFGGLVNLPYEGWQHLKKFFFPQGGPELLFNPAIMLAASVVAVVGLAAGALLYRNAFLTAEDRDPLERVLPGPFGLLNRRFGVDELYVATFTRLINSLALAWDWLDRRVLGRLVGGTGALTQFLGQLNFIIDDTVLNDGADALAAGTVAGGDQARRSSTGKIQDYVAIVFAGVVVLGAVFLYGVGR
jgi:NADH-quinone oxidoreductase subunit L